MNLQRIGSNFKVLLLGQFNHLWQRAAPQNHSGRNQGEVNKFSHVYRVDSQNLVAKLGFLARLGNNRANFYGF